MNTETIVIVSVLSTLGAVALITSIVVAFYKLKGKVGVNDWNLMNEQIYKIIDENRESSIKDKDDLVDRINKSRADSNSYTLDVQKTLDSKIDSRCDKLCNEIAELNSTIAQLKQSFGVRVDTHPYNKKQTKLIKS